MAEMVRLQASDWEISGVLSYGQPLEKSGEALLLTSGAKAYYVGGGWWRIIGYAQDGHDVKNIVDSILSKRAA